MAVPVVFADANVLYSSALRDLLMQLALNRVVSLCWSEAVQDEWAAAVLRARPELAARVTRTRSLMADNLPDANVGGYEHLMTKLVLPDPSDRHVLAAAMQCNAHVLLTFNLKDFPADVDESRPAAVHPDAFLSALASSSPVSVRLAVVQILERLKTPPVTSEEYFTVLSRIGLPQTARSIRKLLEP